MKKIMCILTNGFEELEAVGAIAIWRRAGITVDIFSLNEKQTTGRFNLTLANLCNIKDANAMEYDALFLPGGPHFKDLEANQIVKDIILSFIDANKVVTTICAAPTILGRMGLLEGKKYTCYTSMNQEFKGTYIDDYTAVDGNIITGRSAAAVIDFAFVVIDKLVGKAHSEKIKNEIYYDH